MTIKLSPLATPSLIMEGFKLLWHRRIRWLVIIPVIINILMFSVATWFAGVWVNDWLNWLTASVPELLQWLAWIIWLLFVLLVVVVYAFTFTLFANLVGSPFYGIIAERVIALERGDSDQTPQTLTVLMQIARESFLRELQILAYMLPRTIAVLLVTVIVSFIPLINIFAPLIAGSWAAWSLAVQYFDYPADIDQVAFRDVRLVAGKQRWLSLGFGLSALGAAAIPILNLLLLPATVIGGTLLWCREYTDLEDTSATTKR
jgi:CysZ protein